MGKQYGQLSLEERVEIYRLHAFGMSGRQIALGLGRSGSTISRELRRNSVPTKAWAGGYEPVRAQRLSERRRRWDGRFKLVRQPALQARVRKDLAMGHSPEQIAGRLARENSRPMISHESIYRFIYHRSAQKDYWHRLLPRHKHRRGIFKRKLGSPASFIKLRLPLSERPVDVEDRSTAGHWEADYMLFAKYGHNVLVLHERQTRHTLIAHPMDRKADRTVETIIELLGGLAPEMRKTITFDNGTEFAEHHRLHQALGVQTYFCDPHSPWQKGGVENAIGRLRRTIPRKTDLTTIDNAKLAAYQKRLNETPRKCLDFKTPAELFLKLKSTGALQT